MARLHDLTGDYLALQAVLEDEDASDDAVMVALAKIGDAEDNLERKHVSIACVVRNRESDLKGLLEERARIDRKITTATVEIDRLHEWMLAAMTIAGIEKIKGPSFAITRRKNPHSVVITNEAAIPDEFMTRPDPPPPPKKRPNKGAILAAFKSFGEVVDGTRIEQRERLEIK